MRRLVQEKLPRYPRYVLKIRTRPFLSCPAAIWVMGQLGAAGLKTVPKSTALNDVCKLRETVESGNPISKALRLKINYYFGSLNKAKIALKINKRLSASGATENSLNDKATMRPAKCTGELAVLFLWA